MGVQKYGVEVEPSKLWQRFFVNEALKRVFFELQVKTVAFA